jgi:hypothetical protein
MSWHRRRRKRVCRALPGLEEERDEEKREDGGEEQIKRSKPKKKNKKAEARMIPITRFTSDPNEDDIGEKEELPYATIETVFNTRNAYLNRQHHDPTKIYYNLYDPYAPSRLRAG